MKLNEEEKELQASVERGDWQPIDDLRREIERSRKIARRTTTKDQRINIRISKKDMDALKVRAMEEGMPYQTLVTSIIHKYVSRRLVEPRRKR